MKRNPAIHTLIVKLAGHMYSYGSYFFPHVLPPNSPTKATRVIKIQSLVTFVLSLYIFLASFLLNKNYLSVGEEQSNQKAKGNEFAIFGRFLAKFFQ